jgi:hypothetical protein
MSYDLNFFWPRDKRVDFDAVKAWASGLDCFTPNDSQLWYRNLKTGVYFSLDFEDISADSSDPTPYLVDGYFDSGLAFNLNYNRPSYFAFEAMPLVEKLASRFGLSVFNPQGGGSEPDFFATVASGALIDSWMQHNQRATIAMVEQEGVVDPPRMPFAAAMYMWKYNKARANLQNTCGAEIFAPTLVPVQRKGTKLVDRAVTCSEDVPMIVPEVEWVFIVRTKKAFLRAKKDKDVFLVSWEAFHTLFGTVIEPFAWSEPPVRVIGPRSIKATTRILHSMDRGLPPSDFEAIGLDGFVDIDYDHHR